MLDLNATKANAVLALSKGKENKPETEQMIDAFKGNSKRTDIDQAFDYLNSEEVQVLRGRYMANQTSETVSQRLGMLESKVDAVADRALVKFAQHYQGGSAVVHLDEE